MGYQLAQAMLNAGIIEKMPEQKINYKKFKCHKCGNRMTQKDGENFMYCQNCDSSYFIFETEHCEKNSIKTV